MNISKEILNDLNAIVSVKIVEEDYRQKVEEVLKDYKKKAKVDGFRPGMVPIGLIKKMYYKSILADEINKLISESLMKYIQDEKLRILGEPLPHLNMEKQIDFEKDREFEFSFDLGLVPDFTLNMSSKDKIAFYTIKVDENIIEEYIENVKKRFGEFVPSENSTGDDLLKVSLKQVNEKDELLTNGISVEETSISINLIKDESIKQLFIGVKAGDQVVFDIRKAFPSDIDLATILNTDKEKVAQVSGSFLTDVKEVLMFENHPIDQELFDKAFGEGLVHSEIEFREKITEQIKNNYEHDSNYRFAVDAKKYLLKKAKLSLPVEFLKRWLTETNHNLTSEQVEKEFAEYEEEFQWQLIKDQLIRENEIIVTEEELLEFSEMMARNQFYQYGLYNVPDEHIVNYAREQLSRKDEARRLRDQKFEEKIMKFMKETVKLDNKEITIDNFKKLFEK